MVVNDEHKYVFIQNPNTGSTATANELCEVYGGRSILANHAMYHDFVRHVGKPAAAGYTVIAGIRHPMDVTVTRFFRLRTNHQHRFTELRDDFKRTIRGRHRLKQFSLANQPDMSFSDYFMRISHFVYDDRSSLLPDSALLVRYENMNTDLAAALSQVGLAMERDIPVQNRTSGRERSFVQYYEPRTYARAFRYFGPFMRRFGYGFPEEMGEPQVTASAEHLFSLQHPFRGAFYRYLKAV